MQAAPCYVQSFWHNTGVWQTDRRTDGRTDGQTDGIAVASTALAMRALRRAVKTTVQTSRKFMCALTVAVARSSSDENAIRYVLPVLLTTSCLPIVCQVKSRPRRRIVKMTHKGQHRREVWCPWLPCLFLGPSVLHLCSITYKCTNIRMEHIHRVGKLIFVYMLSRRISVYISSATAHRFHTSWKISQWNVHGLLWCIYAWIQATAIDPI